MVPIFLLLSGCLERVTGEAVPLDPRFYEGVDNGNASNEGGGAGAADGVWQAYTGERVKVPLTFSTPESLPLQVDVAEPDADVQGGLRRAGSFHLNGPEPLVVEVPKAVKKVHIEAFQDVTGDGPTDDDPFASIGIDMANPPTAETMITLVVGARKQAGGGGGGGPGGGGGGSDGVWLSWKGETTSVSFDIKSSDGAHATQVDISEPDAKAPGGLSSAGRLHLPAPAPFVLPVPKNVSAVRVEAFQDLAGDGPTSDDPYAAVTLDMAKLPDGAVTLNLVAGGRGGDGSAAGGAPPGASGGPTLVFPEGPKVKVAGVVTTTRASAVKIDLFKLNPDSPAGRDYLFKIDASADGSFVFEVPAAYGSLELEAYQDLAGDGPSGDDPKGRAGPIAVAASDVSGVAINIP